MAQPIVCSACGTDVPYGRFSCPACGELLASVAGAARRPSSSVAAAGTTVAAAPEAPMAVPDRPDPPDVGDSSQRPVAASDDLEGVRWPDLDFDDGLDDAPEPASVTTAGAAFVPPPDVAVPMAPAPTTAPAMAATAVAPSFATMPGAYVPPVVQPAGPAAPARSWAGHGSPAAAVASAGSPTPGATDAPSTSSDAPTATGVDPAKAAEFVGWMAIAGPALILIGFILPWSSISVIGADGVGYFDRWGFAGPGHPLVMLGVVAIFVMAVLRDRVPLWLGVGLPGIAIGALLLGLVWPYLIGPLGGTVGAIVVAIGALTLIAAGVGAIVLDRHARGSGVV